MYNNLDIVVTYLKFLKKFYFYWQRRVNLYLGRIRDNYAKISSCKLRFSLQFLCVIKIYMGVILFSVISIFFNVNSFKKLLAS